MHLSYPSADQHSCRMVYLSERPPSRESDLLYIISFTQATMITSHDVRCLLSPTDPLPLLCLNHTPHTGLQMLEDLQNNRSCSSSNSNMTLICKQHWFYSTQNRNDAVFPLSMTISIWTMLLCATASMHTTDDSYKLLRYSLSSFVGREHSLQCCLPCCGLANKRAEIFLSMAVTVVR